MAIAKKIRVLHTAALLNPPSGILNQMRWEQESAQELGIPWLVKMYCPLNSTEASPSVYVDSNVDSNRISSVFGKILAWIQLRNNYHKWLMSMESDVDIYILRYYVHDPFQLWFVRNCSKPVFFVHHTLEVPELVMPGNLSAKLRSKLESLIGKFTLPYTAGLIGVTDEILKYELSRIKTVNKNKYIYPNGVLYNEIKHLDKRDKHKPELLFVANFAPWHGLDLLLNSIHSSKEDFILHLVGRIPVELEAIAKSEKRIIVHGKLKPSEILCLSRQCWVGLSSFALYRNKMTEACPLKTREYLMLGLPVYGNYQDTFPEESIFFHQGSEDIASILDFTRKTRSLSKLEVSSVSKPYIDKKKLLSEIYNSVCSA